MENNNTEEIKNKILKGLMLAIKKLIAGKIRDGGELVISENGKILKVKAKELIKSL